MTMILSLILAVIFVVLSGFHFYWLFGGMWGLDSVIPRMNREEKSLAIPKIATLIVAVVLISFALVYLVISGVVDIEMPTWVTLYIYWLIPIVFILRAIGEFRYVGIFRKVKDTKFAKADAKLFSPLSLFIGVVGIIIQMV